MLSFSSIVVVIILYKKKAAYKRQWRLCVVAGMSDSKNPELYYFPLEHFYIVCAAIINSFETTKVFRQETWAKKGEVRQTFPKFMKELFSDCFNFCITIVALQKYLNNVTYWACNSIRLKKNYAQICLLGCSILALAFSKFYSDFFESYLTFNLRVFCSLILKTVLLYSNYFITMDILNWWR